MTIVNPPAWPSTNYVPSVPKESVSGKDWAKLSNRGKNGIGDISGWPFPCWSTSQIWYRTKSSIILMLLDWTKPL